MEAAAIAEHETGNCWPAEYRSFVATCDIQSAIGSGLIGRMRMLVQSGMEGEEHGNCVCTAAQQNTNAVLSLAAERSARDGPSPSRIRFPGRRRNIGKGIAAQSRVFRFDLRRTCAKLCRKNGDSLEQIKFLLGHSSIPDNGALPGLGAGVGESR